MLRSSHDIIEAARRLSKGGRRRLAVAGAEDADVLGAVRSACDDGICNASLFGDESKIADAAEKNKISLEGLEIIHKSDSTAAIYGAVELAASGGADVIMKGFVSTSALLKGVLDKRFDLRSSPTLSHIAVLSVPGREKLMLLTDGGMVVSPTPEQRFDIVKNALVVARSLGIDPVRVALSAAANDVRQTLPRTGESARLAEMVNKAGWDGCLATGPISFDAAFSPEIARKAGRSDEIAGQADVYVVGSIEECNITAKSMIIFAEAIFAGIIIGSKLPVSLVSRTDPVIGKKTSIALACLVSEYYRRTGGEA